ncbi:MAG: RsmE family RNA methyltransferase [Acidobacteriota bacterium]
MNLLLLEPAELAETGSGPFRIVLRDRRAEHVQRVLKGRPGQEIRVGVIGGGRGRGRIVSASRGEVILDIELDPPSPEPPRPETELFVGMPRPAVLHRVLQHATTFGVSRIVLANAWRVEKSYFSSPSLEPEAIRRHLVLGAEQGLLTRLPEVVQERLFVPWLERVGAEPWPAGDGPPIRLLAHPGVETTVELALEAAGVGAGRRRVQVAVGPEGGWIERELETFRAAGFAPVSLGPWVLRVEAAVTAVLAQLEMARRLSTAGDPRGPW